MSDTYKLYYWPVLQGRGEFIRLIFEDTGTPYVDVGRLPEDQGGGWQAVAAFRSGDAEGHPVLAPPVLQVGDLIIAQAANICHFLGQRLGLAPDDEAGLYHALQLQLTVADVVAEVHDTHHPVASSLAYEDQKDAALARTGRFLADRLGKFLGYFERVLAHNGGEVLVGARTSYVDLSLFQLIAGLEYAFPRAFARERQAIPGLIGLRDRVAARPGIAAYLDSPRRLAFNEHGIFRRYPELDIA